MPLINAISPPVLFSVVIFPPILSSVCVSKIEKQFRVYCIAFKFGNSCQFNICRVIWYIVVAGCKHRQANFIKFFSVKTTCIDVPCRGYVNMKL